MALTNPRRVTALIGLLVVACAALVQAQPATSDIRVVGEYTMIAGDTPDTARHHARIDAMRRAWRAAVTRLGNNPAVKALHLKPLELEAYTTVLLETKEDKPSTTAVRSGPVRVTVSARFDAREITRRIASLRTDQDASFDVIEAWTRLERLQLASFEATHLAARASVALARTEQSAIGGRAPSGEGRARAKVLVVEALAVSPDSPDVHSVLGDLYLDALEPELAEASFRTAIAGGGDSSSRRTKLAEALRLQGGFAEAEAELREAIRLDPRSARAFSGLGLTLRGERKVSESESAYREAVRLDPDLIEAHNGLAVALANQGNLEEAVAEFRAMTRIDPASAIGYYNLASALADLDRDVESAAALREVVRINPNHYNARYNLGELFRLEAKYDDSVKQFREYLRLAPDTPQNRRNITRAKSLIEQFDSPSP